MASNVLCMGVRRSDDGHATVTRKSRTDADANNLNSRDILT